MLTTGKEKDSKKDKSTKKNENRNNKKKRRKNNNNNNHGTLKEIYGNNQIYKQFDYRTWSER